ncbi:MAG: epiplasmin family protein [Flammeovirgaceae bacterium]
MLVDGVSGLPKKGYVTGGGLYTAGGYTTGGVVETTVNTGKEVIKGESRIEYVPFEKKIIEYKDEATIERVPKTRKEIKYREER